MRVNLNLSSMNNSQPLRFAGRSTQKSSSVQQNVSYGRKDIDYKQAYEQSQAQLKHMSMKYDVLKNLFALAINPQFRG